MIGRTPLAGLIGCVLFCASGVALLHADVPELPTVLIEGAGARLLTARPVRLTVNGLEVPALPAGKGSKIAVWEFPYLGRPPSRVGHGFVVRGGGDIWVQDALRLELGRVGLDDGKEGGRDLVQVLRPALRGVLLRHLGQLRWLERAFVKLLVGSLHRVDVGVHPEAGALRLHVRATFVNGGQPLVIAARARIGVGLREHRPHLVATEVITMVEAPESEAGKAFFGLPELRARAARGILARYAPAQVRQAVSDALHELRALLGKLAELRTSVRLPDGALKMRWRLSALAAAKHGVRAAFDIAIEGGEGSSDAVAWQALSRCGGDTSPLRAGVSAGLINALLGHLWRRGSFDRVVEGLKPARLLSRKLASLLSFDVKRASLLRPPRMIRTPQGWALAISPLRLELKQLSKRDVRLPESVNLHGWARMHARTLPGGQLRIALEPRELAPSCGGGRAGDPLRPCLEGLAGLARGWLLSQGSIDSGLVLGTAWEEQVTLGGQLGLKVRAEAGRVLLEGDVEGALLCGGLRFSAR